MSFVYADRVKETSVSTGIGNFVLDGAVAGFQTFADGIGDNNQTYYTIFNEVDDTWEVGSGTFIAGVLFRDNVIASTNANMVVDFGVGPKTVIGTVASEFFGAVFTLAQHAAVNHSGLPGVPAPEVFTQSIHEITDHTQAPFNLIDVDAHSLIDHTNVPPFILSAGSHASLSHAALPGVNNFDVGAHSLENHAGLPGIPAPEAFTAAAHAGTNHTGIPGVSPPVPAPDVAAQVVIASADNSDMVELNLTTGTWAVFAFAAWRGTDFNGNVLPPSNLRIGGVVVSTLTGANGDPGGMEIYTHFGGRLGVPGSQLLACDFDERGAEPVYPSEPRIRAFAFRTA